MVRQIGGFIIWAMLLISRSGLAVEIPAPAPDLTAVPPAVFAFQADDMMLSVGDYPAIERWGRDVGQRTWNHFSCRRIQEQAGTVLCLFSHSYLMGSIFANAAHVIEGGSAARDPRQGILGIDLRITDLQRYAATLPAVTCVPDRPCVPTAEQAFLHHVLPDLVRDWQAETVLAAPWGNLSTIEHEILHGQFFSDPAYRQAVWDFWSTKVRSKDRQRIINDFSVHYRVEDEELLVNEFQAYVLQTQPGSFLHHVRADIRPELLTFLRDKGMPPHLR